MYQYAILLVKLGWTGNFCNDDIDECLQPNTCQNGGFCINTQGSYTCACLFGKKI